MKKLFVILSGLSLMLMLPSCSNNAQPEQPVKTVAISATEPETENNVIYQDDNITVCFDGYEELKTVQRINITLFSSSDKRLDVTMNNLCINGISIDNGISDNLEPNETASNTVTILNSSLKDKEISKAIDIQFGFNIKVKENIYDDDHPYYETINEYDTGSISIMR